MQETIGWILCGFGALCSLRVLVISARYRVPPYLDRRPVFESEYAHHKTLGKVPGFNLLVFLGLGSLLLGMYLIGMFDHS